MHSPHDQSRRRVRGLYRFRLRLRGDTPSGRSAPVSRAAEVQMVKKFAAEFGPNNVRFNIISPGLIDAHGSRALFADKAAVDAITAGMPMRRHGEVAEIAAAGDVPRERCQFFHHRSSPSGRRGSQSPRRTQPSGLGLRRRASGAPQSTVTLGYPGVGGGRGPNIEISGALANGRHPQRRGLTSHAPTC